MIRWHHLLLVLSAASLAALSTPARAVELSDRQVVETLTTDAPRDVAIRKGLEFLRARQRPDGSLTDNVPSALASLAAMAHLAAGHTADDTLHGAWLKRSIDYVLSKQDENGYFGAKDASRMYGHGIDCLMLAEALGMCRDEDLEERIRSALERAVAVTVNASLVKKEPFFQGGWRYTPEDATSDLSLSGWQLMSLHAAQQVGITVPDAVMTGAIEFAKRLTTPDGKVGYDHAGDDHAPLRGLSMLCFAIGHQEQASEMARIAARIQADPLQWQGAWFFYRAYYDAVGMSRGSPESWDAYAPIFEKVLIEHQNPDGSWPNPPGDDEGGQGPVYMTSMAVLALAVQRHVLPAYQR
ncbi:MAG: terpene cyclase/mutase family protein [Planctomycetes bacterium]|nr:terpene cyclase/mutase family protein [Planctomycetota bacterium]